MLFSAPFDALLGRPVAKSLTQIPPTLVRLVKRDGDHVAAAGVCREL